MTHRLILAALLTVPWTGVANQDPAEALKADTRFFTDSSCRVLRPEVRPADLPSFQSPLLRDIAGQMLNKTYNTRFRAESYTPVKPPSEVGRALQINNAFSRYEGITGMYLEAGPQVVLVGPVQGRQIALLIPNWMRPPTPGVAPDRDPKGWGLQRQRVPLQEGVNRIEVQWSSNAYIEYEDKDPAAAPAIAVHFPTGKVNGYFDATRHTNAHWDHLLDHAVSPILDARGRYIQVAYPVERFKAFTRGKGLELIQSYDTLLDHHYTFNGFKKYGRLPANRILARVNFNYYMFRDGDGVAYLGNRGTMRMVASPEVVVRGDACWGFCHEVGHALQMPHITWGGMTEVSVNLFSMNTTGKMGNPSRLKAEGKYASARKNILQANPRVSYLSADCVFERLVPFWQLHLYFARNGRPDFYADVMEEMRRRPSAGRGDDSIRNQFEFVKLCCDVARLDLTDFFEKWGFFQTGELRVNDYRNYRFKVTQEMVDQTRAAIAARKYPRPAEDLTLISE